MFRKMKLKDTQNTTTDLVHIKNENKSVENIHKKVDRYITTRKFWDKVRRKTSQVLFVLAVAIVSILYSKDITDFFNSFFTDKLDYLLSEKSSEIKQTTLNRLAVGYLNTFDFPKETTQSENLRVAYLIHKYSNDFYGRVYNLSLQDERFLHAGFGPDNIDFADLCNLNRPFSDDSSQTLKQWLFNKTSTSHLYSAYYNPVFPKLQNEIEEKERLLADQIEKPFLKNIADSIRQAFVEKQNNEDLQSNIVDFLLLKPHLLKTETDYLYVLQEKKQELNLRLGLFQVFLGKEYGVKTPRQMYGWLSRDYKGKNKFIAKGKRGKIIQAGMGFGDVDDYLNAFKNNKNIFKKIDMLDRNIHLYNPLHMPLTVKVVGLFGARRKTEKGKPYKHKGIDLIADEGTPVYPVKDGFVEFVGNRGNGHGNHIFIRHDNHVTSLYSHLKKDRVYERTLKKFKQEGPFWINTLSSIASVGSSGNIPKGDEQYGYPHLHLEIEIKGKLENPYKMFNGSFNVLYE
jgi:murein DD-endopeptidase MepM/ murein hydrolase activator NlpD